MTITAAVPKNSYTANGVSGDFVYTFKIASASDMAVYINGTQVFVGFTVSGVGSVTGGTVTITPIPVNGTKVLLTRVTVRSQGTDWTANDPDPAESKEQALDKLTGIAQEQDEILGRTPQYKIDNTVISAPRINTPVVGQFATALDNFGNIGWGTLAASGSLTNPVSTAQGGTGANYASVLAMIQGISVALAKQGADIASAATITLPNPLDGNYIRITGNTAISAISSTGVTPGTMLLLHFTGSPQITHGAALELLGAVNYTVVPGDHFLFVWLAASSKWREVHRFVSGASAIRFWRGDGTWQFALLHETGGPTDLTIAGIANGQYLRRSGTTVAGVTPPFANEFVSSDQTITASSVLNVAHGLGAKPKLVMVTFKNTTAELNYSVGDEVPIGGGIVSADSQPGVAFDATNVTIVTGVAGTLRVLNKSTQAATAITAANWRYVIRAWN